MKKISIFIFCVLCIFRAQSAEANEAMFQSLQQSISELQRTVGDLQKTVLQQNEVIQRQGQQLEILQSRENSSRQLFPVSSGSVPQQAPSVKGLSQGLNPDIGVAGTVQAHLTEDSADEEGKDTIALKELEISFSQYVDPFSRLDAILTFNDNLEEQNVDIEEAYYSHWGLPLGFKAQLGKFRSKIGKQNLLHLHQLDTVDYPLVLRDFFGEEGLSSSGARLQNMLPNPWDIPVEITGEVLRGNNGNSFSGISRRPIFNTHVKGYHDLTEDANVEVGWTTLFGDENPARIVMIDDGTGTGTLTESSVTRGEGQDRFGVHVYGADVTFNWLFDDVRALKFQNEIYWQHRGTSRHVNSDPWGFYNLLDYRLNKRFSIGARFDYVEPLDVIGEHHSTKAISPYITFWQSEFANFRLQYSHIEPAADDAKHDDAVFFQVNFLIGAHKHPVQ